MLTQPLKISPEADLGNVSKSLQQVRTANPSEILSRTHPSKLQTEPRGEKHIFYISCKKSQDVGLILPRDTWIVCRQDICCVCRQDICCVCSQDICCVSRQEICSLPRHPLLIAHTGRPPLCPQCPGDVLADCRFLVC